MAISALFNPTSLFAGGEDFAHRSVTILSGASYKRGQLLGRITATDKYKASLAGASDGSQLAAGMAVLATDVDASAGDVVAPVYMEGEFAFEAMTVDASWSFATLDAALRQASLAIFIRSVGVNG